MWYLANELMLPLILSLQLGLVVGWATCSRQEPLWTQAWAVACGLAFVLGGGLAVSRQIEGRAGLWLDVALLICGAFIAGAVAVCVFRRLTGIGEPAVAAAQPLAGGGVVAAPPASPFRASQAPAAPEPSPQPAAASVVANPAPPAEPPPPAPDPPGPVAPAPGTTPAPLDVNLSLEPMAPPPGSRPAGLAGPRAGGADDLKRIRGIGPQNEAQLQKLGIWHYDQIAAWNPDETKWVGGSLAFPGRIEREDWVAQAKALSGPAKKDESNRG